MKELESVLNFKALRDEIHAANLNQRKLAEPNAEESTQSRIITAAVDAGNVLSRCRDVAMWAAWDAGVKACKAAKVLNEADLHREGFVLDASDAWFLWAALSGATAEQATANLERAYSTDDPMTLGVLS